MKKHLAHRPCNVLWVLRVFNTIIRPLLSVENSLDGIWLQPRHDATNRILYLVDLNRIYWCGRVCITHLRSDNHDARIMLLREPCLFRVSSGIAKESRSNERILVKSAAIHQGIQNVLLEQSLIKDDCFLPIHSLDLSRERRSLPKMGNPNPLPRRDDDTGAAVKVENARFYPIVL